MATTTVSIELKGQAELRAGLLVAPDLTRKFVGQGWARSGKRWAKSFKRTQLGGRPGILAPKMQRVRDRNSKTFIKGPLEKMSIFFKVSRFLRYHTEGTNRVPKRIKFRKTVDDHAPDIVKVTADDALRALEVSLRGGKGKNLSNLRGLL